MKLNRRYKNFRTEVMGLARKLKRKHPTLTIDEARFLVLDEVFDDLSNGAYFASMESEGYYPEDIIQHSDSIAEKGITL